MTVKLNIEYNMETNYTRTPAGNRHLAKKRVQWLNEALCFVSSLVRADS